MKMIMIIIILATLFALASCSSDSDKAPTSDGKARSEKTPTLDGIDISHWNSINLKDYKDVSFVYAKVSQGSTFKDPKFKRFKKQAKENNILIGGYHFMTPNSSVEEQFENFRVNSGECDLIPMLDVEGREITTVPRIELRRRVRLFIDMCKKHYGKAPIIYCSKTFKRIYFNKDFDDCIWWADSKHFKPKSCGIWQYEVKNGVDSNTFVDATLSDIKMK